jgi:hypothetical protein
MSEYVNPTAPDSRADSLQKTIAEFGAQAKEKLVTRFKQDPARAISVIVAGSILSGFLLGYCLSRMEEENRRHRVIEDGLQELVNWFRQRGNAIAVPIKEGLEATKSAVEDVSQSGARIGRHFPPLFGKQKRSFLNPF